MSEQKILTILETIQKDLSELTSRVSQCCPKRKLPLSAGFNQMERRNHLCRGLRGGLADQEIRTAIIQLRKDGKPFTDISAYIREHWPEQPEKHVPRSTIHRFFHAAISGRLRQFGIEPPR